MHDIDVAIAGLGPVGAVTACLLAKGGLRVAVFELEADIYDKPRAIGLDHEGLRILQACGVGDALASHFRVYQGGQWLGADGEPIVRFAPHPGPYPLDWPPNVSFIQPKVEQALRSHLASMENASIHLRHRVESFEQDGHGVTVRVRALDTDSDHLVQAKYLLACDGASSPIRSALDITLKDYAFDEWWVVVDAFLRRDTPLPPGNTQYCWPTRPATFINGPEGMKRWELKLMPGETPQDMRRPEVLARAMSPYVDPQAIDIWRSAVYRFHALVADRWQDGRVFLVGDAAHQTPPFLGQGLCSGLRDADNLAWRLLHVERLGFDQRVLEQYEIERKPHVDSLIDRAKDFGLIIGELDPANVATRDARLRSEANATGWVQYRQSLIPRLHSALPMPAESVSQADVASTLCPQPRLKMPAGKEALMFDVLPARFLFLSIDEAAQHWFDARADEAVQGLGGIRAVIGEAPHLSQIPAYSAANDRLQEFMSGHVQGPAVLIVRPDRYVHGLARSAQELAAMLAAIEQAVLPTARSLAKDFMMPQPPITTLTPQ